MLHKTKVRFLYLDDGEAAESVPLAKLVIASTPGLEIVHDFPKSFERQIAQICSKDFQDDGLILDLRLDEDSNVVDGEIRKAHYRAPALAQEIRNRAGELDTVTKDLPIVLWSLEKKLKESYRRDRTSHDLFDLIVVKDDLSRSQSLARQVREQLVALVEGYRTIAQVKAEAGRGKVRLHRLLGFHTGEDARFLDSRLLEHFDDSQHKRPGHEYARFIIHHLLDTPGPLIDTATLAARLGLDLDLDNSSDARDLIEKHFSKAAYRGSFHNGWPRWWSFLVEQAWHEIVPNADPLRKLTADERVRLLKVGTRLKRLEPAKPLHSSYSSRYWTICKMLRVPLDARDGFLLKREKRYRWQNEQFVSYEAYEQRDVFRREIDPVDRDRLVRLRDERSS